METILTQLADSVSGARTLEDLTRPLLEILVEVTGLESTYLTTIDLQGGLQHILYSRNTGAMQIPEGLSVPWDDTLCKRSLDEGRTYTADVDACWGDSAAARALGIATYVSTPVRTGSGELYGTLCAASARSAPLPASAEKILSMVSRLIGQHVERERLLERLTRANADLAASALTDVGTGLPNRRAMMLELPRMLARAGRDGTSMVLAFVDLDRLKQVNDTYGHEAGDELLAAVGRRIQCSRRAGDFVARIGGDEFVVLAPVARAADRSAAQAIGKCISAAAGGSFTIAGRSIDYAGASVGVAVSGVHALEADALLRQADDAMYADKRDRKLRGAA